MRWLRTAPASTYDSRHGGTRHADEEHREPLFPCHHSHQQWTALCSPFTKVWAKLFQASAERRPSASCDWHSAEPTPPWKTFIKGGISAGQPCYATPIPCFRLSPWNRNPITSNCCVSAASMRAAHTLLWNTTPDETITSAAATANYILRMASTAGPSGLLAHKTAGSGVRLCSSECLEFERFEER